MDLSAVAFLVRKGPLVGTGHMGSDANGVGRT